VIKYYDFALNKAVKYQKV